jgi:hypothetical protein
MRATIRMEADETPRGWSRWTVTEGGQRIGRRRYGGRAVAEMIAKWLK